MVERVYALIKKGKVVNTIVADDQFVTIVSKDYDHIKEVTDLKEKPSIDWKYSAAKKEFTPSKAVLEERAINKAKQATYAAEQKLKEVGEE